MIWLILLFLLAVLGLPWFAALGLVVIGFHLSVGLDPAVAVMEFGRLRDYETLLALPLLLLCAQLLAGDAFKATRGGGERSGAERRWYLGTWLATLPDQLLQWPVATGRGLRGQAGPPDFAARPDPARSMAALSACLLAPSLILILVGLLFSMLIPARSPGLQAIFLAGLVPAMLLQAAALSWTYRSGGAPRRPGTRAALTRPSFMIVATLLFVLVAGLYAGRWGVFEGSAGAALILLLRQLITERLASGRLIESVLAAAIPFGALALLLGLGLGWAAVVADSGLGREWTGMMERAASVHAAAPAVLVSLLWLLAAAMFRPLPALILAAPLIFPAAVRSGLAAEQLAVITVLALHTGAGIAALWRAGQPWRDAVVLVPHLAALVLAAAWPGLSLWLPGRIL